MAYAFGTVTDYNDFLTKLIEYASGTNPSTFSGTWTTSGAVPSGQQWTVLSNSIPTGGSGNLDNTGIAYLQGPGSESGDNVTVGMKTYNNPSDFIFGVEIKGFTGYSSGLTWTTQPGLSPSVFAALAGVSFSAFFWVNGRRIMATARIGGLYDITLYMGFFLPYGTHDQYPYPLMVSGTVTNQTYNYTQADYGQSGIPAPGNNSSNAMMQFRFVDGTWQAVSQLNIYGNSSLNTTFCLYPLASQVAGDGTELNNAYSEDDLISGWAINGNQLSSVEVDSYPIYPVVINSGTQLPGQLDGIYYVPGNGLNPGDTITIDGQIYDVFHNCWRSTANAYYVIERV